MKQHSLLVLLVMVQGSAFGGLDQKRQIWAAMPPQWERFARQEIPYNDFIQTLWECHREAILGNKRYALKVFDASVRARWLPIAQAIITKFPQQDVEYVLRWGDEHQGNKMMPTYLAHAVSQGFDELVTWLIEDMQVDLNAPQEDHGLPALYFAQNEGMFRLLTKLGANVEESLSAVRVQSAILADNATKARKCVQEKDEKVRLLLQKVTEARLAFEQEQAREKSDGAILSALERKLQEAKTAANQAKNDFDYNAQTKAAAGKKAFADRVAAQLSKLERWAQTQAPEADTTTVSGQVTSSSTDVQRSTFMSSASKVLVTGIACLTIWAYLDYVLHAKGDADVPYVIAG